MSQSVPVLVPPHELTDASIPGFEEMLEPHVASGCRGIVLDLGQVTFINSTGLGSLVKVGMKLDRDGRRLALARPEKQVERMLRLVGLDSKLPVFKTLAEASGHVGTRAGQA